MIGCWAFTLISAPVHVSGSRMERRIDPRVICVVETIATLAAAEGAVIACAAGLMSALAAGAVIIGLGAVWLLMTVKLLPAIITKSLERKWNNAQTGAKEAETS